MLVGGVFFWVKLQIIYGFLSLPYFFFVFFVLFVVNLIVDENMVSKITMADIDSDRRGLYLG